MLRRELFAVPLIAAFALLYSPSTAAQQSPETFHVGTRMVLTDVSVTDPNGNPVHGLKASDFQIFDDDRPQVLASFEEHVTKPVSQMEPADSSAGAYSNEFLQHLPSALSIIVVDITNLKLPDQMYLAFQLNQFFKALPPGRPIALYWQSGQSHLLLQNFTTDRGQLSAALRKAIPRFPPPDRGSASPDSSLTTLQTIENDLDRAQYPGRKNVLWFSGGSSLFLHTDPMNPQISSSLRSLDPSLLRDIYDQLETDRIAIYPVDARGLQSAGIGPYPSQSAFAIAAQQGLMRNTAEATGGAAFYNNNALDKIAAHWLESSGSFYTLTYSPKDLSYDNKWHTVKIRLSAENNGSTLSYRRGYFADATSTAREPGQKTRTMLRADGDPSTSQDQPGNPIIFQVTVLPASHETVVAGGKPAMTSARAPKKGAVRYSIHYSLPATDFTIKTMHGRRGVDVGVAVLAFNQDGAVETQLADKLTFQIDEEALRLHPRAVIPADQQINLSKGQKYLSIAVWDMTSGRLGTLEIPLKIEPGARQTTQ
jgi:VWFA-related protein